MTRIGAWEQAIFCIPDLHRVIITGGGDALAVRRPCYAVDGIGVTRIGVETIARMSIPDLYCFISACRGQILAIRRPCHPPDICGMTAIRDQVGAYTTGWSDGNKETRWSAKTCQPGS